ncbi:Germin-like protein subfamily 1 member 14 [Morella rubra]|uniref:Germin-like protein n=1 Tax=Morella rubra TaxID=262757 RepID=A0A6A1V5P2_9ROSI|nr:Germin-like protein subfamily 1 member 14 [Morella rubra]
MEKGVPMYLVTVLLFALACSLASAFDPSPLQDFCVATKDSDEFVNGKFCNNPKDAKADDFFFSGLDKPGDTSNKQGSNVTLVNVDKLAGLNTLGISVARIDFAPYDNRLFTKVLNKGDVFVFPIGLIHFQWNMGNTDALIFAGLSSQNPGVITIANAVFGSNPPINPDVLTKAFQVDKNVINYLEQQFK